MTSRIPTAAERNALADHLTLLAVGAGIDTVAALASHLGVCERQAWRYLDRLTKSKSLVSSPIQRTRTWKLAPEVKS